MKFQVCVSMVTVEYKPFDVNAFVVVMWWTVGIDVREDMR